MPIAYVYLCILGVFLHFTQHPNCLGIKVVKEASVQRFIELEEFYELQ